MLPGTVKNLSGSDILQALVERPLVLPPDFLFFFRGKVVLSVNSENEISMYLVHTQQTAKYTRGVTHFNAKVLADLLRCFPPDLFSNCLACDVQQALDVQVVRGKDQLKQLPVVWRQKLLVESFDLDNVRLL